MYNTIVYINNLKYNLNHRLTLNLINANSEYSNVNVGSTNTICKKIYKYLMYITFLSRYVIILCIINQ